MPITLLVMALAACSFGEASVTPLEELTSNPERYDGQMVRTEGVYVEGFEARALASSTRQQGEATILTQPIVWLEGDAIESEGECFTTDTEPPAEFCRATVAGRFEYGGSYGHGGGYDYQITAEPEGEARVR